MKYLLQLEWKKVNNYTPFRVMMILFLIALPASLLITKSFPEEPLQFFGGNQIYSFPTVWKFLGYAGSWIGFFFLGFMAVLSVTSEFGNKTLRQNIITGLSRKQFFLAKVTFIFALAVFATIYYSLVGAAFGFIHTDPFYWDVVQQNLSYIFRFFLMSFGYMSLGVLLGTWIRRTGIAIFLFLAYGIMIEQILRWGAHYKILEKLGMEDSLRTILFYPVNAMEDLAPIPIPQIANDLVRDSDFNPFMTTTEAVITSSIYIALFLFVTYRLMKKRDL